MLAASASPNTGYERDGFGVGQTQSPLRPINTAGTDGRSSISRHHCVSSVFARSNAMRIWGITECLAKVARGVGSER